MRCAPREEEIIIREKVKKIKDSMNIKKLEITRKILLIITIFVMF